MVFTFFITLPHCIPLSPHLSTPMIRVKNIPIFAPPVGGCACARVTKNLPTSPIMVGGVPPPLFPSTVTAFPCSVTVNRYHVLALWSRYIVTLFVVGVTVQPHSVGRGLFGGALSGHG